MGSHSDWVLVVDDEAVFREVLVAQLGHLGITARHTADGQEALALAGGDNSPAILILDIEMPGCSGLELLQQVRHINEDLQVVMVSGYQDFDTVREALRSGAYDYLPKPFDIDDLSNTMHRALERRHLIYENRDYQEHLEHMVRMQTEEIRRTTDIALLTLAKLAESRDSATGIHLERMAAYSRILAQSLKDGPYSHLVDELFVNWLFKSSPLHDIGKVGIPDAILRKPGPLTSEETLLMHTHTQIGGDTLRSVLQRYSGRTFLNMAMEIAYSHHEHWDGGGYPAGIAGEDIPLAARIVALADAYDAITSARPYKPAYSHGQAVRRISADRGKHFDPVVVDCFLSHQAAFADVQRLMKQDHSLGPRQT